MSKVKVEKHNYTVEPFYQWDRNQVLEIHGLSLPRTPEVHFYNITMDRAIVRQATTDSAGVITVSVPNGLLQKPYTITAHLCVYTGATFETQYTLKLPVTPRTQPADYTIEDDGDVYSFNKLGNRVGQAVADLKAAEARFNDSLDELGQRLIDTTLSQPGKAADAKAVSDALATNFKALTESVVLWENQDDTVEFPAQTVPLDLSGYKRFNLIFRSENTAYPTPHHHYSEVWASVKNIKYHAVSNSDKYAICRAFTITDTGVNFEIGRMMYTDESGLYLIPCKIIGYKY